MKFLMFDNPQASTTEAVILSSTILTQDALESEFENIRLLWRKFCELVTVAMPSKFRGKPS